MVYRDQADRESRYSRHGEDILFSEQTFIDASFVAHGRSVTALAGVSRSFALLSTLRLMWNLQPMTVKVVVKTEEIQRFVSPNALASPADVDSMTRHPMYLWQTFRLMSPNKAWALSLQDVVPLVPYVSISFCFL